MTPGEVHRLLDRQAPIWRRRIKGDEGDHWIRALARYPESRVLDVVDRLTDEGVERPKLTDVTRRLNTPDAPAVQEFRAGRLQWDGPADRGRALIADAKRRLHAAPEYVGPKGAAQPLVEPW